MITLEAKGAGTRSISVKDIEKEPVDTRTGFPEEADFSSDVSERGTPDSIQLDSFRGGKPEFISKQTLSEFASIYSLSFIQYKTKELVVKLTDQMNKWAELDVEDALIYVKKSKDLLDHYSKYTDYSEEARVLVGTLQLIFDGDTWEKLSKTQLLSIVQELKRFKDGEVNRAAVVMFSKQLLRAGINPLS
jgi:hypothetical protein